MEFYGDYHMHTRYSDGEQDLEDIVEVARGLGLKEIAITDHGPLAAVIGIKNAAEYLKIKEDIQNINSRQNDIKVWLGAEANIRGLDGELDIPQDIIEELDILIAGLHPYTLPTSVEGGIDLFVQNSLRHLGKGQKAKAIKANTRACIAAMKNNPRLDILSHPGLFFEVDIREIAKACVEYEVLFEINCGHGYPRISDIIEAEKQGVKFIINSDAHFPDTVGELEYGSKIVEKLNIAEERVVNRLDGGGMVRWGKNMRTFTFS